MNLINLENISKTYNNNKVLDNISITINDGEKIGIVGANGAGKSTLIKIMSGKETPDTGNITTYRGLKITSLDQMPEFNESLTVENLIDVLVEGQEETVKYSVHKLISQLGLNDFSLLVKTLSGGEKKKIALAVAIMIPCDLLILDEPTNHLDMQSILWLENYLKQYKGSLVMITHDRYFLDKIVNVIVEIRNAELFSYKANFSTYMDLKAQEEESLIATERKNKSLYRKELEWMKQGAKARGTKSKERIARFDELENRVVAKASNQLEVSSLSTRLGKQIIEIDDLSLKFSENPLIKNFSHTVLRDDRIGIVGENGSGKTSLLKMIAGELTPSSGTIKSGSTVKIGYFCQEHDDVVNKKYTRVIDYIKETAEIIDSVTGKVTASQMLERFLFTPEKQYTQIGKLSGGEQKRLFLLKLLMSAPNILLLDEPTNDFDIDTLQILEDYLETFPGAVITVSHDRYFLDKVVDDIFAFEPNGKIVKYTGNYSDYFIKKPDIIIIKENKEKKEKKTPNANRKLKFTFKEQYDYEHIDGEIEQLEKSKKNIEKDIEKESANYQKLEELLERKTNIEKQLEEKLVYWEYLYDLAEKISSQDK